MLAPPSGIEPSPPTLEGEGLTSGPPGRPLRESLSQRSLRGKPRRSQNIGVAGWEPVFKVAFTRLAFFKSPVPLIHYVYDQYLGPLEWQFHFHKLYIYIYTHLNMKLQNCLIEDWLR